MSQHVAFNRRETLTLGLTCLAGLVIPGCSKEPKAESPKMSRAEELIIKRVQNLPTPNERIGSKVSETIVPGAEKLLIVVRYGHLNEKTRKIAGPRALEALTAAAPQTLALVDLFAHVTGVKTLSGDGLMPQDAERINDTLKFLRTTRESLGSLVEFRDVGSLISWNTNRLATMPPTDPQYSIVEKLHKAVSSNPEQFDRVLREFHAAKDTLLESASGEPIVRVAFGRGLTLQSLEEPALHARAFQMATTGGDDAEFQLLSEQREDAILDSIARLEQPITILIMGASHRFSDNAEKRRGMPIRSRVSVVEYNPAAFPDESEKLKVLMEQ